MQINKIEVLLISGPPSSMYLLTIRGYFKKTTLVHTWLRKLTSAAFFCLCLDIAASCAFSNLVNVCNEVPGMITVEHGKYKESRMLLNIIFYALIHL